MFLQKCQWMHSNHRANRKRTITNLTLEMFYGHSLLIAISPETFFFEIFFPDFIVRHLQQLVNPVEQAVVVFRPNKFPALGTRISASLFGFFRRSGPRTEPAFRWRRCRSGWRTWIRTEAERIVEDVWKGPETVWPDWAINWTLGNFTKPVATIILLKSPTFVGNFWKSVKIFHFSSEIFFGQLLYQISNFLLVKLARDKTAKLVL